MNLVSLALTSANGINFNVKSKSKKKITSDFFIGQSIRFRKNNNFGSKSGLDDQISDLVGRIGFGFGEHINMSYRFLVNKDALFSTRRDQLTISTNVFDSNLSLNYIYLEPTTGISDEREELNLSFAHNFNENYSFKYTLRDDMTSSGGLLGQKLSLSFDNDCISLI